MNCQYHPNIASIGECKLCGTPVCQDCMTVVKGNVLCPECIRAAESAVGNDAAAHRQTAAPSTEAGRRPAQAASQPALEPKSKFLTFVLSFLPGLGHLYIGLTRQGIELMALFFGTIWLTSIFGGLPFAFVIPVLFFYGIFDALQKRDRMAQGKPIDPDVTFFKNVNFDWFTQTKWVGWVIIGFGGLLLLKQAGAKLYVNGFNDIIVAVLLVLAGVWMLNRERRQPPQQTVTKEPKAGEEQPRA